MSKHKVRYRVVELEMDSECETRWGPSNEPEYAVDDCVKHFDEMHYDPETTWPLTFALLNEDGSESGRYTVGVEMTPSFSVVKIDEPEGKSE